MAASFGSHFENIKSQYLKKEESDFHTVCIKICSFPNLYYNTKSIDTFMFLSLYLKLDFLFWHLLSMLTELPLWMHFKTEYQTFSNLVQEGLYRIALPISRTVSYSLQGHNTQPTLYTYCVHVYFIICNKSSMLLLQTVVSLPLKDVVNSLTWNNCHWNFVRHLWQRSAKYHMDEMTVWWNSHFTEVSVGKKGHMTEWKHHGFLCEKKKS